MSRIEFGTGQYVVHAKDRQQALLIVTKELSRFDRIKYLMSELVVEDGETWKNFMINTSEERLNIHFNDEKSLIFDKDTKAKGQVRQQKIDETHIKIDEDGCYLYELAYRYPDIQGHNADFRLAHEMGHLMLEPSNICQQTNQKLKCGEMIRGSAINLLAQLAIRGEHSADDIIFGKVDVSEENSYTKTDNLVKLLVISMRNDFDRGTSFEKLMNQKIDSVIKHSDGTQGPVNTFFYGILNDASIIEKEFDKYMGRGAWRKLDSTITKMHQPKISKEKIDLMYNDAQKLIVKFADARMKNKYKRSFIINEFEEIITPEIQEQKNQISVKQKVAQFFRKYDFFMNLTFVENFVNKQLNVFPTNEQSAKTAKGRLKQDFENWLSNNGELKKTPVTHIMSETDKTVETSGKNNGR